MKKPNIAVVIPCYKVKQHIEKVIQEIPSLVDRIYVIDDACPDGSGEFIAEQCKDIRITIIKHTINTGVGGALLTGYKKALAENQDIIVKLDGDGQMDPSLIPRLIKPLLHKKADYTKGNRFFTLESLSPMPTTRKIGNTILSFVNKVSSGYWNIMDPTNGFTAIHKSALALLPLDKIHLGYFFESDMLFRLGTIRAVVQDVPMQASYGQEQSNLSIRHVIKSFPKLYCQAFLKRVFYNYFLRDFNRASIELLLGVFLILFGTFWGGMHWIDSIQQMKEASTGTVMLAVLPIILGFQFLLDAINFDASNMPDSPLQNFDIDD